jgi:hypothetical protein
VGLGQCSRGQRLRVEAQAVNRRRNHRNEKSKPIIAGAPSRLRTNLKLAVGRQGESSRKAGEYVCNYSMYVILDFIKRRRLPIRFGFIHIPHDYQAEKAMRLLEKGIGTIRAATARRISARRSGARRSIKPVSL